MSAPTPSADCNLLFGIIALQMDFISRDQLVAAMNAWVLDKARPLGRILLDQSALDDDTHALLDALVCKHLARHGTDPVASLAALSSLGSAREDLSRIPDAAVQATLALVGWHHPADDPAATPLLRVGTSSGARFRVLRPHARGSLGQVSVAMDEELHREVALKEMQVRLADHPESRARFLLEAEVTGGLEHPGVVPVYGLGTYDNGRPFYAMRFIRGHSLHDTIRRLFRAGPVRYDSVEFRQLLGRFTDICQAAAYAHSRGVLHRDLKPGNVMLGKYGETLIVDWGLAKSLDQMPGARPGTEGPLRPALAGGSSATAQGSAIGTPAYMSPEQAAGRLDDLGPASDVYSLGATLYELLTGHRPFNAEQVEEVLEKVRRGEFPPPRAVTRPVPRPLEAVCLKAMAFAPADRYPGALDLAADVEHWLADESVSAYREPWTSRAGRWARRHRTAVATAATLLVAVAGGLAVTAGLVWREKGRTTAEFNRAEAEKERAEANLNISWDLTTGLADLIQLVETGQDPSRAPVVALRGWADKTLAAVQVFLAAHPDDPARQFQASRLFRYSAHLSRLLNNDDEAEKGYREAVRLYHGLADRFPDDPAHRMRLADTLREQAGLLRRLGRLADAAAAIDRAIDEAALLVAGDGANPGYRRAEAMARVDRAEIRSALGLFADAEQDAATAARLLEGLPAGAQRRDPLFRALAAQQSAKARRGRADPAAGPAALAPALEAHDRAVGIARTAASKYDDADFHYILFRTLIERARTALRVPDRRKEAVVDLDETIHGLDELLKQFPGSPLYRESLGEAYTLRGRHRAASGDRAAAAGDLTTALRLAEELSRASLHRPEYRSLLGEVWVGRAEAAATQDEVDVAVDRALSSFRAARNREGDNPAHALAIVDVEARWPDAAARSAAQRKAKGGKP